MLHAMCKYDRSEMARLMARNTAFGVEMSIEGQLRYTNAVAEKRIDEESQALGASVANIHVYLNTTRTSSCYQNSMLDSSIP